MQRLQKNARYDERASRSIQSERRAKHRNPER
jgi:hypothetical protein